MHEPRAQGWRCYTDSGLGSLPAAAIGGVPELADGPPISETPTLNKAPSRKESELRNAITGI